MVTSDIEKNRALRTMIRASDQRRFNSILPLINARLRWTTGVSGAIQLSVCTILGNEVRGKKTPLKKNIGVMNRVK